MTPVTLPTEISEDTHHTLYRAFAKFLCAFQNCDQESQQIVQDMVDIINDPDSEVAEQRAAIRTISEALFPSDAESSPA